MYDVFLNFRGEDTRFAFTDYLYHGLADVKKLQVFRDDPGLELGDEIKPALMEAIKRSRMFIVVMSENYVSSSWCLLELEEMLKYSNNGTKRLLVPIFYRVAPAEVRYQISIKSKEAMKKHEERHGKDKVLAWKSALSTVCGLSGEHILDKGDHYETEVIGKVAEQVSAKLVEVKQQLNAFGSQFEEVESLLNLESCDTVGTVGVYEDPKIGKSHITTFAFELYYKIKYEFRAASFLVHVSKKLKENATSGLENLQKELLSDMGVKASSKQELQHKRVLVVLEGVDSKEHLELLLVGMGICDLFGPGSRIIITTENKDLFENYSSVMKGVELKTHCIREGEFVGSKWIVKEKNVVGFVKDFIHVINQLREEDSKGRNVVSIVGMGGSGKTTLARKVYDSSEVRNVFPCRAWATVSKDYREKEVFSSLFRSLMPSTPVPEAEEELKRKVRRFLKEQRRKYLIVLDDVWDTQVWDKLKDYLLPNKNNGSRILVTTRNNQVANYARSKEPHHEPSRLNEEESWELLSSEVFCGEECPAELESIGKSIAKSCKGLPLAIVTIAGVIKKRERSKTEWKRIENLTLSCCVDEDIERMKKILKMSYDYLPENLKPCFLYLGVFPEDCKIVARELIELWMVEGLIKVRGSGRSKAPQPEDVGEEYLKALVDRNLVQVVKRKSDGEGVKTCQIHDLFRDMCIEESEDSSLALDFPCNGESYLCSVTCEKSHTCSFLYFGVKAVEWSSRIPEGENLRANVLYFSNSTLVPYENDTDKFTHLRYLRMLWPLFAISSLYNLETLDIKMPSSILTITIGEFKQLRHLRCHGRVELQGSSNKLQNLQTLYYVSPDSVLESLINGGCFPNLKTLGLVLYSGDEKGRVEELRRLQGLKNLSKLKLRFNVKKRILMPALSVAAVEFLSNLTKITLVYPRDFNSRDMAALGRIPNLETLKLCQERWTETLSCGEAGSFPKLQVFLMIDVSSLKCLTLEEGVMPCLRRVVISDCCLLKEIPERLLSLSNLRHLHGNIWEEAENDSNKYELIRRTPTSSYS
ncbi:hypothetical protein PIB30_066424 [Stylosanthes scabra]|uniref:TIR domain-containing protein n=1 Tax=Stylosanthes scabra TaxID=79078 RepID=A0ABU6TNX1_9FABA|nr:hypothetical protein [Stylosanthes scabra]